jgi:hypothetical protein
VAAGALDVPHDHLFDRMLIVQGRRLGARIVTCDDAIRRYATSLRLVASTAPARTRRTRPSCRSRAARALTRSSTRP